MAGRVAATTRAFTAVRRGGPATFTATSRQPAHLILRRDPRSSRVLGLSLSRSIDRLRRRSLVDVLPSASGPAGADRSLVHSRGTRVENGLPTREPCARAFKHPVTGGGADRDAAGLMGTVPIALSHAVRGERRSFVRSMRAARALTGSGSTCSLEVRQRTFSPDRRAGLASGRRQSALALGTEAVDRLCDDLAAALD